MNVRYVQAKKYTETKKAPEGLFKGGWRGFTGWAFAKAAAYGWGHGGVGTLACDELSRVEA
jgi:hypothetical protein